MRLAIGLLLTALVCVVAVVVLKDPIAAMAVSMIGGYLIARAIHL